MTTSGTGAAADSVDVRLAAKRDELESELATLSAPANGPGDDASGISFGKRVGDGTSIAVDRLSQVAAHERLQAMLDDVRRAEAKRADGSYGRCDRCGARITSARLEALPWATLCIDCAAVR